MTRRLGVWMLLMLACLASGAPAAAQDSQAFDKLFVGSAGCTVRSGSGSPEGAVLGTVCDTYVQSNTGDVWTKQSGTGNTGWTIVPRLAGTNTWTGVQTFTQQLLAPDGTNANPAYSWANDINTGFRGGPSVADGWIAVVNNGATRFLFGGSEYRMGSGIGLGWNNSADPTSTAADVQLFRGGAGVLELRVGTNPTGMRIYNTVSGADFERGGLFWTSNEFRIGTQAGGTGTVRSLVFESAGGGKWYIPSTGFLLPYGDATYDLGSTAQRVRNIHASGTVNAGNGVYVTGPTRSFLFSTGDGLITLFNNAATGFTRLNFGGNTASFPSVKRNSTALNIRLADDSGDAPVTAASIASSSYVSQTTGWSIDSGGRADVRYLYTDELRAKLFTADLESVLAGSSRVTKSFSTISQTFTCPALGATSTLWVKDAATFGDAAVFVSGDSVVIRSQTRATFGPFTIADCVGVVTSYTDGTAGNAGQQSWTFTRNSGANGGSMTASTTVAVDQLVQDLGTTGNGYVETTAVDGAAGVNAPYVQVNTWATAPIAANTTTRCRLGNLNGITSTTEYGLLCGNYSGNAFVRFSDVNAEIRGIPLKLYDGATETVRLDASVPSFAMGSTLPSAYGTGTGIWMGKDAGAYKFRVGDPAGNRISYDGNLTLVSSNLTINSSGVVMAPLSTIDTYSATNGYTFSSPSGSGSFGISGVETNSTSSSTKQIIINNRASGGTHPSSIWLRNYSGTGSASTEANFLLTTNTAVGGTWQQPGEIFITTGGSGGASIKVSDTLDVIDFADGTSNAGVRYTPSAKQFAVLDGLTALDRASTTSQPTLTIGNGIGATYTGTLVTGSVLRAASTAFNFLDLSANGVSVFKVDGLGSIVGGLKERGRSTPAGEWTNVAHAGGNFTASSGTWTVDAGDQGWFSYTLVGKTMTVTWGINTSDVSAAAAWLGIAVPGGFTVSKTADGTFNYLDAGATMNVGLSRAAAGSTVITLFRNLGATAWTITAGDNTYVTGSLTFEIQ